MEEESLCELETLKVELNEESKEIPLLEYDPYTILRLISENQQIIIYAN